MISYEAQIEQISREMPDVVDAIDTDRAGCPVFWVRKERILSFLGYVRRAPGLEYEFLSDLTAYDALGSDEESKRRFVVVYNLFSLAHKMRIRVKVGLGEGEAIPSAIELWAGANWAEREVYDMFGVKFDGHPDLRRILMDQRWEGHPLRKDYYWRKYQLFSTPEELPEHLLKD